MFAIFHKLSYDHFNLCISSVHALSNIMMQTLYLRFCLDVITLQNTFSVKIGEGSLLETLTKSTPISGGREFPLAMKLMWL